MKKIILILFILLSLSLYPNTDKQNDFEVGATLGIFTSSGFFLKYNVFDDISLKASGFLISTGDNEKILYESRLSIMYSLLNSKNLNIYLISAIFKGRSEVISFVGGSSGDNKVDLKGFSLGVGLKLKLTNLINFIIELQGVRIEVNNYHWYNLANLNFGFSFDL
jgi:hypothetical protein